MGLVQGDTSAGAAGEIPPVVAGNLLSTAAFASNFAADMASGEGLSADTKVFRILAGVGWLAPLTALSPASLILSATAVLYDFGLIGGNGGSAE